MNPSEPNPADEPPKPHTAGAVPERDVAQVAMWGRVAVVWPDYSHITLVDCTPVEYAAAATAQGAKLKARQEAGVKRPLLGNRLDAIRDQFANALPYIKADLLKIFKKEGVEAAYPSFGMSRREGTWQFDHERLTAQDNYDTLVAELTTQNLTDGEYGATALGPLAAEFRATYKQLVQMDQDISEKVGAKNLGKPWLKRQTKRLRLVLEGNYPETYEQVARAWGIQKEKF